MHLRAQVRPDNRDLPEGRIDQLVAQGRIPRQAEAEDGRQQQEQGNSSRELLVTGP